MPFDSLFTGVSGMNAFQSQIDVISNNLANVDTTGFKGQNVNFEDLLYQQQSYASAPSASSGGINGQDIGIGVKVGSVDTNFSEGGLNTTGVNTNLAINGNGFFVTQEPGGNSAPTYTRNGDFSLNANGLLYNPADGSAVQGYTAVKGAVPASSQLGDLTIPLGLASQAVGTGYGTKTGPAGDKNFDMAITGNLDQTQWQKEAQGVEAGAPGAGQSFSTSTTIYDSLGNAHEATITYKPDAAGAIAGTATAGTNPALNDKLVSGVTGAATAAETLTVTVNATGTAATVTDGTTTTTAGPNGTATIDGVTVDLGGFDSGNANATTTFTVPAGGNVPTYTSANPSLGSLIASVNGSLSSLTGNLSVTVNATGTQAMIADAAGNTVSGAPGSTVSLDGTEITLGNFTGADSGAAGTVATTASSNGLPVSVSNANGTATTPATRWQVSISFADGTQFDAVTNPDATVAGTPPTIAAPSYAAETSGVIGYAYFDQNGQYINTSSTAGVIGSALGTGALAGASVHTIGGQPSLANGNQLNVVSWGQGSTDAAVSPTGTIGAAKTGPIGLDFSNNTSLGVTSTDAGNALSVLSQNGYAQGTLENISIGSDGTITGAFTNGQNTTLGRVAIATFQNDGGLTLVGGSNYSASANSGLPQLQVAGTGSAGSIVAGSLEESNVSIAEEFTKMIAAQRAFQANSSSIQTASQDLQTIITMKASS